jgi:hypothetical protein
MYEYVMGWSPTHSPRFACSRLPADAVPEMLGSRVFVGRFDVTTAVGFEVARAEPSTFVATICERIRNPASPSRRTYGVVGRVRDSTTVRGVRRACAVARGTSGTHNRWARCPSTFLSSSSVPGRHGPFQ